MEIRVVGTAVLSTCLVLCPRMGFCMDGLMVCPMSNLSNTTGNSPNSGANRCSCRASDQTSNHCASHSTTDGSSSSLGHQVGGNQHEGQHG